MLIDISQEVFSCTVFPGDPAPSRKTLMSISDGDVCNLTEFSMCAHNGTHIDAPFHFLDNGRTVDEMGLEPFVGKCYVARHEGDVSGKDASAILANARACGCGERILIAGRATVTEEAAALFAEQRVKLIGNESQTVGPENAPKRVHLILLGSGAVLLEGLRLAGVEEGGYFFSAAPLNLGGCAGAPCRAFLMR